MHKLRGFQRSHPSNFRVYILKEEVEVPSGHADKVDSVAIVADDEADAEEDPRKVGRSEVKDAEQAHVHALVTATPHIHHHESEG